MVIFLVSPVDMEIWACKVKRKSLCALLLTLLSASPHPPEQYLYAPWKAPHHVQLAAGCVIGVDYPHPIVDHTTAGALCCERLRRVMSIMQQFSLQNFCGKKTIRVDQFPANSSHA